MADEQLELPGVVPELTGQTTAMVTAAHRSLAELERVGTITTRHAVQVQLAIMYLILGSVATSATSTAIVRPSASTAETPSPCSPARA